MFLCLDFDCSQYHLVIQMQSIYNMTLTRRSGLMSFVFLFLLIPIVSRYCKRLVSYKLPPYSTSSTRHSEWHLITVSQIEPCFYLEKRTTHLCWVDGIATSHNIWKGGLCFFGEAFQMTVTFQECRCSCNLMKISPTIRKGIYRRWCDFWWTSSWEGWPHLDIHLELGKL